MNPLLLADVSETVQILLGAVAAYIVIMVGFTAAFARFYRKAGPEEAIVRTGQGGLKAVTGSGIWLIPLLHRAEQMDLSVKRIDISQRRKVGLICKDDVRADIDAAFFVRVNNTSDDICSVAQSLGCRRASDPAALVELFAPKFCEALKTVAKQFDFAELYEDPNEFKEQVFKCIAADLNGFVLDDCAIHYLDKTPVEQLDP